VAPKFDLVRIVAAREDDGPHRAVLDPAGTLPGRGAYLCRGAISAEPARDCLALALRRGGLARALRAPVAGLAGVELVESVSR
jgi:predicted RNA-binding protein YlxR (DUF448 family)